MPRSRLLPAALLLVLALMCAMILQVTAFGMLHDDGVYLVTAKSLAEGHGYRIISLPNDPVQTKYPIVLPLLLSIMWRMNPHFPENAALLKAVPVAATLGWLILCYWFVRRYGHVPVQAALWIVFFVAVNQWSLFNVGTLMSDTLFAALALAAVAALIQADQWPSIWPAVAAGLLVSAAYYTRTAGLPIALAGVLALGARRRIRQAAVFGGIVGVAIAAWMLWQRQAVDLGSLLENYYTAKGYVAYTLFGRHFPLPVDARIFAKNLYYLAGYPAQWMFGLLAPYSLRYLFPLFGLFFWSFILRGLWKAPSSFLPAKFLAIIYSGMLVFYIWPPDRFLLPLLPLLLLFAYYALPARTPVWLVPALALMPLFLAFSATKTTLDRHVATVPLSGWAGDPGGVEWGKIAQVQNWVRAHGPPGAVVLADYDPAFYLYSGHKSIRPYYVAGSDLFYGLRRDGRRNIRECLQVIAKYRPKYLVETGHDSLEEPTYPEMISYLTSTGKIRLLKQIAPHYRIFEVEEPGTAQQLAHSATR